MYSIEINKEQKVVLIKVTGFFNDKIAHKYKNEFQEKVESITTDEYKLIIDGSRAPITRSTLLDKLTETFEMYVSLNFKGVFMLKSNSLPATTQAQRIIRDNNFPIKILDSIEEI